MSEHAFIWECMISMENVRRTETAFQEKVNVTIHKTDFLTKLSKLLVKPKGFRFNVTFSNINQNK